MSSSAINQGVLSAKISNVQNVGDTSSVCSTTGDWSFKNATATATNVFISNAGNVGIGTTSPLNLKLDVAGNVHTSGSYILDNDNFLYWGFGDGSASIKGNSSTDTLTFNTVGSPRMTIDASGALRVGNTSGGGGAGGVVHALGYNTRSGGSGSFGTNSFNIFWTSVAQLWIDSTNVGTIAFSSDYRIKKNIETQELPAIERIAQLRPVKYEFTDYKELFKADGVQREGFIAHELQAVIPSAVEGQKDDENQIQSLKLDALCSVMVKAIQELSAKVDFQDREIRRLKGEVVEEPAAPAPVVEPAPAPTVEQFQSAPQPESQPVTQPESQSASEEQSAPQPEPEPEVQPETTSQSEPEVQSATQPEPTAPTEGA